MAGRFPFDATGDRHQQQLNSQMRAALGFPTNVDVNDVSLYIQAQRQQQELQRDFQIRQMMIQEQLDQDFGGQRLRSFEERFQHDYRHLLLNEQLQQQQVQAQQQQHQHQQQRNRQEQAYLRDHAAAAQHVAAAQQAAAAQHVQLSRYQDEVRRHQLGFRPDDLAQPAQIYGMGMTGSSAASNVTTTNASTASNATAPATNLLLSPGMPSSGALINLSDAAAVSSNHILKEDPTKQRRAAQQQVLRQQHQLETVGTAGVGKNVAKTKRSYSFESAVSDISESLQPPPKRLSTPEKKEKKVSAKIRKQQRRQQQQFQKFQEVMNHVSQTQQALPKPQRHPIKRCQKGPPKFPSVNSATRNLNTLINTRIQQKQGSLHEDEADTVNENGDVGLFDVSLYDEPTASFQKEELRKGTLDEILTAALDTDIMDEAADTLRAFELVELSEFNEEDKKSYLDGQTIAKGSESNSESQIPAVSIVTATFTSKIPDLPTEPLFPASLDADDLSVEIDNKSSDAKESVFDKVSLAGRNRMNSPMPAEEKRKLAKKFKKVSTLLEYPYPVDTWWPSTPDVKGERRQDIETSDEDEITGLQGLNECATSKFYANEQLIRKRLSSSIEPGFLEKLPHCKLHQFRTKKRNGDSVELLHCIQVTELYPNDIMVNCSVCGTWRHAACGGHFETYSSRKNAERPFVAVCEHCQEERKFMKEYPKGEQRLGRQRMEQLRRALSTSAVMRYYALSKFGDTCKLLGNASATHNGGQTRNVQIKYEKAEKQWSDMASQLARENGYRPKERVRIRTKELEQILESIEDAENYTDCHNILLFLIRDTSKDLPVGLENQSKNILDPADDDDDDDNVALNGDQNVGTYENKDDGACARVGCFRHRRFDSIFCSDGCGVLVMEIDLMFAIQEALDIHPSALRHK